MVDKNSHDLDLTVSALKDGVTDLGADGGLIELGRWVEQLADADDPDLQAIGRDLGQLEEQLRGGSPDAAIVSGLLTRVGEGTVTAAGSAADPEVARKLRELGNLLTTEGSTLT